MAKPGLGRIDNYPESSHGSAWRDPGLDLGPNFKCQGNQWINSPGCRPKPHSSALQFRCLSSPFSLAVAPQRTLSSIHQLYTCCLNVCHEISRNPITYQHDDKSLRTPRAATRVDRPHPREEDRETKDADRPLSLMNSLPSLWGSSDVTLGPS